MAQLHLKHFITWFHLHLHLIIFFFFFFLLLHGGADAQSSMEPVPTYINHHTWEPSFAITLGAVICALLFMGIITIYVRKCAQSHIITSNRTTSSSSECSCSCSQGITKELLNTFPILFYPTIKDLKIGKGSLECAVCLTDFKDCDTLRLLPKCDHVFHPQCIDSWLCSHVTCPVCRANLNKDSCQVSVTVLPTQLNTPQRVDESSGTEAAEQQNGDGGGGGEENEVLEQNPQVVENEVQVKIDDGVPPKSKLLRSNSTGHSLVEQGKSEETQERFTLRLPEDVRRYILVNNGGRVHRSASYNNNNNMVRGMCWSDSEGSSKGKNLWVLWSLG